MIAGEIFARGRLDLVVGFAALRLGSYREEVPLDF